MTNRLVVNGCSYMHYYDLGNGTKDLAKRLNIDHYKSLAKIGVCNSRILRTTLMDMYSNNIPTLYILGMTFVNRFELTLLESNDDLDGSWVSYNGLPIKNLPKLCKKEISLNHINEFSQSHVVIMNSKDLLEDLMYRLASLIDSAKHKGHKILIFNTAEHIVDYCISEPRYNLFRQFKEIIGGFDWRSIPWQFDQGAEYLHEDEQYPANCRHVEPGQHRYLNQYLTNYIQEHKILQ